MIIQHLNVAAIDCEAGARSEIQSRASARLIIITIIIHNTTGCVASSSPSDSRYS